MVLIKYIILFFLTFSTSSVTSETLSKEEDIYFNFIDFNNDESISYQEADNILKLIFSLLDKNQDNIISKNELLELKNIIESLS
tara:strand:- start:867 stop:1118 length:252 start_codon:yes stop_codon:yes gene_type:complete